MPATPTRPRATPTGTPASSRRIIPPTVEKPMVSISMLNSQSRGRCGGSGFVILCLREFLGRHALELQKEVPQALQHHQGRTEGECQARRPEGKADLPLAELAAGKAAQEGGPAEVGDEAEEEDGAEGGDDPQQQTAAAWKVNPEQIDLNVCLLLLSGGDRQEDGQDHQGLYAFVGPDQGKTERRPDHIGRTQERHQEEGETGRERRPAIDARKVLHPLPPLTLRYGSSRGRR